MLTLFSRFRFYSVALMTMLLTACFSNPPIYQPYLMKTRKFANTYCLIERKNWTGAPPTGTSGTYIFSSQRCPSELENNKGKIIGYVTPQNTYLIENVTWDGYETTLGKIILLDGKFSRQTVLFYTYHDKVKLP